MLHPVMPFITEELWHALKDRAEGETIMFQPLPTGGAFDAQLVADFATACEVVVNVRAVRQARNIAPKEPLKLQVKGAFPGAMAPVVKKMAFVSEIELTDTFSGNGEIFMVGTTEFGVPLDGMVDVAAEIAKIEAEIQRYEGFLRGVNAKLSNEKFVANAPAKVVETERKKLADATMKIENLRERLAALNK
jgi:valyl-tRNA synthetase